MKTSLRKTGFVHDEKYMRHNTGRFHPEIPERIRAVFRGIEGTDLLSKLVMVAPENADLKWVETVHDKNYIERLVADYKLALSSSQRLPLYRGMETRLVRVWKYLCYWRTLLNYFYLINDNFEYKIRQDQFSYCKIKEFN